jgi:hypothetical protein
MRFYEYEGCPNLKEPHQPCVLTTEGDGDIPIYCPFSKFKRRFNPISTKEIY